MKILSRTIHESIKLFYAIVFISTMAVLTIGVLPSIVTAWGEGGGGCSGCGEEGSVDSDSSYVYFKIDNNHHPSVLTVTKLHISAELIGDYGGDNNCDQDHPGDGCRDEDETKVKQIKLGPGTGSLTTVYSTYYHSNRGYCCCSSTGHDGHLYTFDTNYSFSTSSAICRIRLDQNSDDSAEGYWTVTFYYTLPGDAIVRQSELIEFEVPDDSHHHH